MKKLTALLTAVILMLCMLSGVCFAASSIAFNVEPAVYLCGDIYNIVWSTTASGTGYVDYTYDGVSYRVYDEEGGVVRTDDYIHTVSVPIEHLDGAGAYTVTSVAVTARTGYSVTYGTSCTTSRSFRGYEGQEEINIWSVSDTHREPYKNILNYKKYNIVSYVKKAAAYLEGDSPDIVVLLGDISNDMPSKDYAEIGIFKTATDLTSGEIPVVYTRGNHETRGEFAGYLLQYLPSDTGEFYFTFEYGPMSSIVLDFGEDKLDSHEEYNNFVDYEKYRNEQTKWLSTVESYTGDPTYRVAFCHGPSVHNHFGYNWLSCLSDMGSDVMLSGHSHASRVTLPGETQSDSVVPIDFPIIEDGGHEDHSSFRITQLLLSNGNIKYYGVSDKGVEQFSGNITAGLNVKDNTVASAAPAEDAGETVNVPTAYGAPVSTVLKSASADFGFITKPTVFDTGDTYTVSWATTEGYNSMGEIYIEYEGNKIRFIDEESGTARCLSNIHAVRIPKKYLENNSYNIVSKHVITHGAYTGEFGNTVSTGKIKFKTYNNQEEIKMLYVSDINSDASALSRARAVASGYDMLVLGGNTVNNLESSTVVATDLLHKTGLLSSGTIPVAFVRGENETAGEYAPYLTGVVRNSTRQFYETVEYGPVSAVVLDTAGLFDDDNEVYNDLAAFDSVYEKQFDWLKNTSYGDATYKLVFSRVNDVNGVADTNYVRFLNTLGCDLSVSSLGDKTAITDIGEDRNYVSITDGSYSADGSVATMLTFKNGNITADILGENGVVKQTKSVVVADNDNYTYSDVAETAWYSEAVNYTAIQRTMVGTSATTFAPERDLNRAMAVTVLARLVGVKENDTKTPFTDVKDGQYYTYAVNWGYENKIVLGTSETTFDPESSLTREQLVTLLYRMYGDTIETTNDNVCVFSDFDSVSDYAKEAVTVMSGAGIINGMGDNTFSPKGTVTRAQLSQILYKSQF